MKFKLEIKCSNSAFRDEWENDEDERDDEDVTNACRAEVARILRDMAKHLENGCEGRTLQDSNGNRVGMCNFESEG